MHDEKSFEDWMMRYVVLTHPVGEGRSYLRSIRQDEKDKEKLEKTFKETQELFPVTFWA